MRRGHCSSVARREPGDGPPVLALVALAAVIASGCLAPRPLPSASAVPPPPPTTSSSPGAIAASSPAGAPTAIPDLEPSAIPLTTFTLVCEDWGSEAPPSTIDCAEAAALALSAIDGESAAATRRLDFRFGEGCDPGGPCVDRRPDAGWVVARSVTFETIGVRVALDPAGELRAWPPVPGPAEPPPAFTPPSGATVDVGDDLPAELRLRRPVASCGVEDLTAPDAFATTTRTCFLGGVLAGVPVEFASRAFSTEGHALLTLYRYTGRGPVLRYTRTQAGWTGTACGISPIPTTAVFIVAGTCDRLRL